MEKSEKETLIADLSETFRAARSVVLVDFRGMNVANASDLRRQIAKAKCGYVVVKNTLALIASKDTAFSSLSEHFTGPTAVAYTTGDPVALAKVLTDFAKTVPTLQLKAAFVEGKLVAAASVGDLARLPSRAELLGKLLGLMNSPAQRLASVLSAPARNLAFVLSQIKK